MAEKMVLSTSLLIAYENVGFDYRTHQKKYKRLMRVLSLPYKTNKKQWVEARGFGLNDCAYQRLLPQLIQLGDKDAELEALAAQTRLKVILTEDENAVLPYVNYKSSFLSNELTIGLKPADCRINFVQYLQRLCASALKITICDNYFGKNWENTQALFHEILPRHRLLIEYVETHCNINDVKNSQKISDSFLQTICVDWSVTQSKLYKNLHDRYLLIESPQGKIELMLSSGFDHIWKRNPKEITCVLRDVG